MNYEFITRSAISLALLYSLFFACLSRETFHRFNRVCLLLTMLVSLVLPVVHFTVSHPTAVQEVVQIPAVYLRQMPIANVSIGEGTGEGLSLTWGQLLTYIYLAGVGVMLVLLLVQTIRLCRLMRGGLRHTDNRGNTVILKPSVRSPFSLFRWIVMSVDDYEQHRQSILTHEQEHIRLHHSYDLLLLEAMKVLQWFNPFIWLLGHDLRAIHEYEADEAVIKQGIDAKHYQQLLVLKAVGNRLQPFANTLGRGSLKQRIIMMYQKKSNRWMMLKALFVIPAMGFALYAFATPEALPDVQAVLEREVPLPIAEAAVATPATSEQAEGDGVLNRLLEEGSDFYLECDGQLDEIPVRALGPDIVFIIDGVEATEAHFKALAPKVIDHIIVIKDEEASKNFYKGILGDREVKGIIVVETQEYAKQYGEQRLFGNGEEAMTTTEVKAGDRISGQVIESPSYGAPLAGVKVEQITPEGKVVGATITDANGHFEMIVNDPRNRLVFTKDGYEPVRSGIGQDLFVGMTSTSIVKPSKAAHFAGGDRAFKEFLSSNLTYPREAQATGTSGSYLVHLVIREDGNIHFANVLANTEAAPASAFVVKAKRPVSITDNQEKVNLAQSALWAECMRMVGTLPRFIPAENDGKKVDGVFTFSVSFVLE